ncbi:PREDICTED: putative N-acetylglucosamine-6-phosphate deacetylase [Priapulus caudatus]|uniref:N-acetylglucosamine-6-phosphate deacetylase n=1 Tax=Priapulus caudatus TaxID=37621 RepID=A0ABM1EUT7_PRICU|nr:PREDICTED: putative N-acetylglucosamine-6-phosphate deacetylase [Priapulus caudatus]XP_014675959.1 PREDICTED: putative N-acetylglucosamine-6-phosphate deacetylase [Priapulus caudatus]XP_014675960.1 PREDICTED: putative N-acetylglucosamine-6-phosphate deacetylase [Priapulus caudatus]
MPTRGSNKSEIVQFRNCRILRHHQLLWEDLWIRDGRILNPEHLFYIEKGYADVQVDCGGQILASGFIDVQINGAFGIDFSTNGDVGSGVDLVAKRLLEHGVTSFCPTIITSPSELYKQILPKIPQRDGSEKGAGILGVHIEGPFICPSKKGAHPESLIRRFDKGFCDVEAMYGTLDNVVLCTIAPDLPNAPTVAAELAQRGVKVSLGHSGANLPTGEASVRSGASFITHLFNAMAPFHHRDPGLIGLLASDVITEGHDLFYGIIADGVHTHPAALRMAHRLHPKGVVLVTDAMAAMGLPPGRHHLGQQLVDVSATEAVLVGTDTLAGSIATMQTCVQFFYHNTECSPVQALEAATLHPARLLGVTRDKGTLDYGTHADFLWLDNDLTVKATYIAGKQVWGADHT